MQKFLKNFLQNLGLLAAFGLVLFVLFPEFMSHLFIFYGALFGPLLIIAIIIFAALPR